LDEKVSVKAKTVSRPVQDGAPASLFFLYSTQLKTDQRHCEICGADRLELDLLGLARGLSTSPAWKATPDATLVVRQSPRPVLGVVGRFDAAAKARLATLGPQLAAGLSCLRHVSYAQAEEDVNRLASMLIERFGRDELRRVRFAAMPRGGFVVLGMLSYALGLRHAQLEPPYPQDVPLVVVDDCAISGYRFNQFLTRYGRHQVVFAHLYSHPELRRAIEARRPHVIACVGARNLYDHAPERYGAEYGAWREQWVSRLGDDVGYWLGQPGHLCFSWNEPDVTIWNPSTEKMERGWRIVPPELCLKNGGVHTMDSLTVQVQLEGSGPLRPSEQVIFGEFEGNIVVGHTETRASFTLTGVAADMWRCVVEHGNLDEAVVTLLREYDVDPSRLRADLRGFVEDLLAQELLECDGAYPLDG
jgi:hypothetical protein